jgi:hypothetical protein
MAITHSTAHRQALLVLAAVTAAIPAAAQERSAEPPEEAHAATSADVARPVRLAIHGLTPGAEVRVVPKSDRLPEGTGVASCTQDGELELQKGTYTLIAIRGAERNTQEVELTSSQVVRIGETHGVARTMGIAMGITGVILGALGGFVTVAILAAPAPPPDSDEDTQAKMGVFMLGLAGLAAGTGLAIGGFALAAANHAPSIDLRPMPLSRPPPGRAGANISLSGKF